MAQVSKLMEQVVKNIKKHDGPVGVAISGGLDSTVILHEVCKKNKDVHTFCMKWGYERDEIEEHIMAWKLSVIYKAKYHAIQFDPSEFLSLIMIQSSFFNKPRWNLWPIEIIKAAVVYKVKDLYVGEGCDEILGYTDRSYLQGWISQLEYIWPVWKIGGLRYGVNIHAPFLEVEQNNGIPNTIEYHLGKRKLYDFYKDRLRGKVIFPKKKFLCYYNILKRHYGWKEPKKELMKFAAKSWADTH